MVAPLLRLRFNGNELEMTRERFVQQIRDGAMPGSAYVLCPPLFGDELWHRVDETSFWSSEGRPDVDAPQVHLQQQRVRMPPKQGESATARPTSASPSGALRNLVLKPRPWGELAAGLVCAPLTGFLLWRTVVTVRAGGHPSSIGSLVLLAAFAGSLYVLVRSIRVIASGQSLEVTHDALTLRRWSKVVTRKQLAALQPSDWKVTEANRSANVAVSMFQFNRSDMAVNLGTQDRPVWVSIVAFGAKRVLRLLGERCDAGVPAAESKALIAAEQSQPILRSQLLFPGTVYFVSIAGHELRLSRDSDASAEATMRLGDEGRFYVTRVGTARVVTGHGPELAAGEERPTTRTVTVGPSTLELQRLR